uniref:methylated diphthine methylhydrolase n=1 Tax=Anthurium amnicola TaxID=1678845 RepID=A0A1D1XY32_9ARAE
MDVACFHLDGNADAVEFCPQYPFHHILAAATYTLQEGVQPARSGSISLFSVEDVVGLELIHRVETVGIFDIKWSPSGAKTDPLLAQADAHGCLSIHSLKPSQDHGAAVLREAFKEKVSPSMCLCLDWNPSATCLSVGLSDGSISLVSIGDTQLQLLQSWEAHEYEVWAASFDVHQPLLLYTGSDDCCFSCWDLRQSPSKLVFRNAKSHKMGVCSIAKCPSNSNMLLTGSYDEFLRVWDLRAPSKPLDERSVCLGGGVWRIKHHPDIPGLVLAACMHNGFAVVKVTEESAVVVENYRKHESLAYGADWRKGGFCNPDGSRGGSLVATCSFYDRLLRIWSPESLLIR